MSHVSLFRPSPPVQNKGTNNYKVDVRAVTRDGLTREVRTFDVSLPDHCDGTDPHPSLPLLCLSLSHVSVAALSLPLILRVSFTGSTVIVQVGVFEKTPSYKE